ncbi:hypothetical protein FACS189416_7390 [Bacteroidia bacterium]|nr:hypothetical protein FACS189416_7390 [Bacteroidia bacterium]
MSDERKQYIAKHKSLFWYTPEDKKEEISDSLLVETILNYGTLEDVKELIKIMGIDNTANVFFSAKGRMKGNYYPEIYNFFNLIFTRYAQRNS